MRKAYSEARIERVQLGVQNNSIRRPSLADAADCERFAHPAEANRGSVSSMNLISGCGARDAATEDAKIYLG